MTFPNGKKSYAELNYDEQWQWHSEVYAFRHLFLDQPLIAGTAPTDPSGKWFDRDQIGLAVNNLRAKRQGPYRQQLHARGETLRREGVQICNQYAQNEGFTDWQAALDAGRDYSNVLRWIEARSRHRRNAFDDYNPTPQQMAAGRAELGITEPKQDAAE